MIQGDEETVYADKAYHRARREALAEAGIDAALMGYRQRQLKPWMNIPLTPIRCQVERPSV